MSLNLFLSFSNPSVESVAAVGHDKFYFTNMGTVGNMVVNIAELIFKYVNHLYLANEGLNLTLVVYLD